MHAFLSRQKTADVPSAAGVDADGPKQVPLIPVLEKADSVFSKRRVFDSMG